MTAGDGGAFPVATRRITDPDAVRAEAAATLGAPVAVWRRGDALLEGYGLATRLALQGPERIADAASAWRALAGRCAVDDRVRLPGTGAVAFGAFTFADASAAPSVLVVPRRVVGVRDGIAFRTDLPRLGPVAPPSSRPPAAVHLDGDGYRAAVAAAVDRIRSGELEKVVLARDVVLPGVPDVAAAAHRLAERYREAWAFAVDGFFGASPETLVTVRDRRIGSRVLAGTAARFEDPGADGESRDALLSSPKNRFEHALAVDSLLLTLGERVEDLVIGRPFALGLPNVWHLATDATARVGRGVGALDLVAALHPTAAVAGAPRAVAQHLIAALEPFDRRRYAGPVGWIDGSGDGEWAIGLRSAESEGPDRVRAYAGAGIVAGSDADQELAETEWKLAPVREAVAEAARSTA
ncbi:isochorismate synthase [Amnibacterium endophyticum]|uniref:isochorismate synthase n=1 Tax=Amnibacterium endophyticum TaxID=2109337 RepID=A0ABW4LDI4_9MICO